MKILLFSGWWRIARYKTESKGRWRLLGCCYCIFFTIPCKGLNQQMYISPKLTISLTSHITDVVQAEDLQSVWEAKASWGPGGRVGGRRPLRYSDGQLVYPESHLLCGWHLVPHHPVSLQQIRCQHSDSGEWHENQGKRSDILVRYVRSVSKVILTKS